MFNHIKEKAMHPVLKARLSFINLPGKDCSSILMLYAGYFEWLKTQEISNFLSLELDIALGNEVLILSKQYKNNRTIPDFALYAAEQILEKAADFGAVFPVDAVLQTDKKGVLGKEYYTKFLAHYENVLEQFDETNKDKFTIYNRLSACAKRFRDSSLEAAILERKKQFLWEQYNIKQATKYFLIIY